MVETINQNPAQHPAQQEILLPEPQPQVPPQFLPQFQPQNQLIPQPRVRRTHKDDFITALFGKLDLRKRLERNKVIQEENKARASKTVNHHLDPVSYPQPGSEAASFITIDEADVKVLKDPSIFARLMAIMPDFLIFRITRENQAEKEEKEKRKLDELAISPSDESHEAKRRRIDGSKAADRTVGSQRPIEFSQILFTTDIYVPIPITFFRNENLRYLINHAAVLPMIKSNPLPGEAKGQYILNIAELTKSSKDFKGFGAELSLDFGEWSEAAVNCFRFHQMQDRFGDKGDYAQWWSSHFNFFNTQDDKISQYDAWKGLEFKLRQEYRTEPTKFDIAYYATRYEAAKQTHELKLLIDKQQNNQTNSYKDRQPYRGGRPSGPSAQFRDTQNIPTNSSFPSGSRQSHPVCCILCSEKGHPVRHHYNDENKPTKFPDGKPTWAKIASSKLCTPNGKEICINHNVNGGNAICSHPEGARVHLCSFCGSKSHHAFSWICRSRPSPSSH
jgi:hypothetical protein